MPLCTTHLNKSDGYEMNNFEIKSSHIDGNMFIILTVYIL